MQMMLLATVAACACDRRVPDVATVSLGDRAWTLEIAATPAAIQDGLMHREKIPFGTGMLFVFEEPSVHRFWMANCLTDIDVAFLDGEGRIVTMHTMKMEPPRRVNESVYDYHRRLPLYSSAVPVRFAIELPAGSIDVLDLHRGMKIPIDAAGLKRRVAR